MKMDRTCRECGQVFRGTARARCCPSCAHSRGSSKRRKYRLDEATVRLIESRYDSHVMGRAAEIGQELGWPTWAVKRAALKLGLTRPWPADRRAWTGEEVIELKRFQGLRSAKWIARRLGRGPTSVILKMRRLGLDRRVRNGYTMRDLARCFGVESHLVAEWIKRGWIVGTREGTPRPNDAIRIQEATILDFVRAHREEFRLARVDQAWFLGLVLDGPRTPEALVRGLVEAARVAPPPAVIARRAAAIRRANGEQVRATTEDAKA